MTRMPTKTTVVEYDSGGDATVLEVRTRPLPAPGPGEVTVEVMTAGLNHIDSFIRAGAEADWDDAPWPRASGSDFAGIVVGVGAGVTRFARGAEVIGHVREGAQATFLNVAAGALVAKPRAIPWEQAGGLYLAGATALATLDELRIGAGDVLVVSAAAGGVGSVEVQIARHLGAEVIGTCGDRNFDYLRQLGITPVRYGEGMARRIRDAAGSPVTAMIDNFGQDGADLAAELGVPAARYRSSADRRDTELRLLQDDPASVEHGTQLLERLIPLAERRAFTLLVSGFYPFDDVAEAYEDLARLHSRGKVILGTHPVTRVRSLRARDIFEAAS